jgi:high-affinity nickel permease
VTRSLHLAAVPCFLSVRGRTVVMMLLLTAANGLVWLWVWAAFEGRPTLVGSAMLAYGLGLRHAVDANAWKRVAARAPVKWAVRQCGQIARRIPDL